MSRMDTNMAKSLAYDHRIDAIRGVACILLVAFHVIGEQATHGLRVQPDHPLAMFAEIFIHLRMPLFAMLSGFVYAYRPASSGALKSFFTGKARRLGLPFVFAATLFAGINTALDGAWAVEVAEFWKVYTHGYAQFWFIQSIMTLFVIVGLTDALFGNKRLIPLTGLLVIFCVAFLSKFAAGVSEFAFDRAIYLGPFFITGVLIHRLGDRLPVRFGVALAIVALIGLGLHTMATFNEPGLTLDRRTFTGLFLALGLSSSLVIFRFRSSWLEKIGRYSYSIYLYHMFAIMGLQFAYGFSGMPAVPVAMALGMGLGLGLPMIAEEMAKFTGRYVGFVPVLTLGVKPKPRAEKAQTGPLVAAE